MILVRIEQDPETERWWLVTQLSGDRVGFDFTNEATAAWCAERWNRRQILRSSPGSAGPGTLVSHG